MKRTNKNKKKARGKALRRASSPRASRVPRAHRYERNHFERDLAKTPANYVPLSPLSFLPRAAHVFPKHTAIIHGRVRRTWAQTYMRCRKLASALRRRGIKKGDCVALMAPNIPAAYEAAFGVPMTGGVLNAMNIRLDAPTIAFMLEHG